jgi:biopolymer transport protein ExbB/TolQ
VEGLSVLDMIQTGWIATYPLILFSVLTLSIVLERVWSLRNLVSGSLSLARTICPPLERGDFKAALQTTEGQVATPAGRIFADVLAREAGKALKLARAEVERAISTFQIAAEESTRITGEILPRIVAEVKKRLRPG